MKKQLKKSKNYLKKSQKAKKEITLSEPFPSSTDRYGDFSHTVGNKEDLDNSSTTGESKGENTTSKSTGHM